MKHALERTLVTNSLFVSAKPRERSLKKRFVKFSENILFSLPKKKKTVVRFTAKLETRLATIKQN